MLVGVVPVASASRVCSMFHGVGVAWVNASFVCGGLCMKSCGQHL